MYEHVTNGDGFPWTMAHCVCVLSRVSYGWTVRYTTYRDKYIFYVVEVHSSSQACSDFFSVVEKTLFFFFVLRLQFSHLDSSLRADAPASFALHNGGSRKTAAVTRLLAAASGGIMVQLLSNADTDSGGTPSG